MEPPIEGRDPDAPDADVLPEDAPRGAPTIPGATDTGQTTPPVSGWGETLEGEERGGDAPPD